MSWSAWMTRFKCWAQWRDGETITIHLIATPRHRASARATAQYQVYHNHVFAAEGVLTSYRPSAGWPSWLRRVAYQVHLPLRLTKETDTDDEL